MLFTMDTEKVKKIGRTVTSEGVLWCGLSGSGAAFHFNGTRAAVTLCGDDTATGKSAEGQARVAIYVNEIRMIDMMITKPEQTVEFFKSPEPQEVDVRIIKLSECPMSTFGIRSVEADTLTGLSPEPPKKHRIEFIGDSITCGFGVDTEDVSIPFETNTEDATRAYAMKVAAAFCADYSLCAYSGYGIVSGYTDNGEPHRDQLVPTYYEKVGFSYAKPFGRLKLQELSWDFSKFVPELIVVNLGTNDDSYCQENPERIAEFISKYAEFLKLVRERNREAYLLCTVGTMCERILPAVGKAVALYQSETADTAVSFYGLPPQQPEDGLATYWHPTERTHQKAADLLCKEISRILGW